MRALAALAALALLAAPLDADDAPPAADDKAPATLAEAAAQGHAAAHAAENAAENEAGQKALPQIDPAAAPVDHDPTVFGPDPAYADTFYDPEAQWEIYGAKHLNKTARPLLELGRKLFVRGALEKGGTWLGAKNPTAQHLMAYGDWRTAVAYNDDGVPGGPDGKTYQARLATRLNLDVDWAITSTERFHFFVRPFDDKGSFTRWDIDGKVEDEFVDEFDFDLDTAFFEGELGPMMQGFTGRENKIDLAFAVGLMPMLTQNGVWLEDAFVGGGFAFPAFSTNSPIVSNLDITVFFAFDKVTTTAVVGDHAANVYGFFGFADAAQGYWEWGYGYLDADQSDLSYHNVTVAFSRRYGGWLSNSVRLIGNLGQSAATKTADGVLLLIENSLISPREQVLVPYLNLFVGLDSPVPMAKAEGGVLKNTGIHFETDGLTGYPQLDDRGQNAWGGALGLEYLFDLDRQIVVEVAAVRQLDDGDLPFVDDQFAVGIRFQQPLDNAWILRCDAMKAFHDLGEDAYGARVEIRRKF